MLVTIIIILALVLSFINTFSPSLSTLKDSVFLPTQKESTAPYAPQTSTPETSSIPQGSTPETSTPETQTLEVTTRIISGPKHNEVVDETNQVTFRFELKIPDPENKTRFETKVLGFDNDWKSTSSNKRTVTLPPGPKEYTFLVREKEKAETTSPYERKFKLNISPYFGKVEIKELEPGTKTSSSLITLDTDLEKGEQINMTGWQLQGRIKSFDFSKGIQSYHPIFNPVPNEDIIIKRDDTIYLSAASTPLGLAHVFKTNQCTGYLDDLSDFPIPIPEDCPDIERDDLFEVDESCQEYILDLDACEVPKDTYALDSECRNYVTNKIGYGSCFSKYSKYNDFLGDEWHMYLNFNLVLTGECHTLYLRDQNGLFVNKYYYDEAECF